MDGKTRRTARWRGPNEKRNTIITGDNKALLRTAFPDLRMHVDECLADSDLVAIPATFTWTGRAAPAGFQAKPVYLFEETVRAHQLRIQ